MKSEVAPLAEALHAERVKSDVQRLHQEKQRLKTNEGQRLTAHQPLPLESISR